MRIVSLLPACTEWVAAFGGLEDLVGRSHACDFPPGVEELPALTRRVSEGGGPRGALSPFEVDRERLAALRPDLILTQTACADCAVTETQLRAAMAGPTDTAPRIFSLEASTMKQVLNQALALGRAIGRTRQAMAAVGDLEVRLHQLQDGLGMGRGVPESAPSVAALEWFDPPMAAGHWNPDLIELAGARPVCARPGLPSAPLDWQVLLAADPDVLALFCCGMGIDEARGLLPALCARDGWSGLTAVRSGRVYLFDGSAYFNRPGPRLYRSIELIAAGVYGEASGVEIHPGEMVRIGS